MRSTQKKPPNNGQNGRSQWQIPERTNVFLTPGAQRSIEEAEKKGETVRVATDRPEKKLPSPQKTSLKTSAPAPRPQRQNNNNKRPAQKKSSPPPSLAGAIIAEIKDRIKGFYFSMQLNSEDVIMGVICALLLVIISALQTTFFVRFAPFGAVPDLMLVFVIGMGVSKGEKWGSVAGLAGAFVIQALGSFAEVPEVLSLLYMPAGCATGLLSKYYLRHTLPVNAAYIAVASLIRSIVTVLCAAPTIQATPGEIILHIAIPEFFSTLIISPLPFLAAWLSFKHFNKTRAERTESGIEI